MAAKAIIKTKEAPTILDEVIGSLERETLNSIPEDIRKVLLSGRKLPFLTSTLGVPGEMQPSAKYYDSVFTATLDSVDGLREAYEDSSTDGAVLIPREYRQQPDHNFASLKLKTRSFVRLNKYNLALLQESLEPRDEVPPSEYAIEVLDLHERISLVINSLASHGVVLKGVGFALHNSFADPGFPHAHRFWSVIETISDTPGTYIFSEQKLSPTDRWKERIPYQQRKADLAICWGSRQHQAPDPKSSIQPFNLEDRLCYSLIQDTERTLF